MSLHFCAPCRRGHAWHHCAETCAGDGCPKACECGADHGTLIERQLAAILSARLTEVGMTQAALARRLGKTQKHVSMVLTGKAGASFGFWTDAFLAAGLVLRIGADDMAPIQ
jgi:hypothetical protein